MTAAEKKLVITPVDLKSLPQETAKQYALDAAVVKGHTVYFIPVDGPLGYSSVVYRSGRILPYASDHANLHPDMFRQDLRRLYLRSLEQHLYTDQELAAPLEDYPDYRRRRHYLVNHYPCQRDYISGIYSSCVLSGSPEEKAEIDRIKQLTQGKTFDPINFAWFDDAAFVAEHIRLWRAVSDRFAERGQDFAFMRGAFLYEMANHEYAINWQGNWDVLSCFGKIEYDRRDDDQNLDYYFDQLRFTPTQRAAFHAARQEYFRRHGDDC